MEKNILDLGLFKNGEHGSTRSNSVLSSQNEDEDEGDDEEDEDDDEAEDIESHEDESTMNRSRSQSPTGLSKKTATTNSFQEGSPLADKIRPFSMLGSNLATIQSSPASLPSAMFMLPHSNTENEKNLNENFFHGLQNFSSSLNQIKLLGRLYNDLRFNASLVDSASQPAPSAQSKFPNLANF
jgi:hypothetical protein